jgi:hypothetical protein
MLVVPASGMGSPPSGPPAPNHRKNRWMSGRSAARQLYGAQQGSAIAPPQVAKCGRQGGPPSNPASMGGPPASQQARDCCPQLSMQLPLHVPFGTQQVPW